MQIDTRPTLRSMKDFLKRQSLLLRIFCLVITYSLSKEFLLQRKNSVIIIHYYSAFVSDIYCLKHYHKSSTKYLKISRFHFRIIFACFFVLFIFQLSILIFILIYWFFIFVFVFVLLIIC